MKKRYLITTMLAASLLFFTITIQAQDTDPATSPGTGFAQEDPNSINPSGRPLKAPPLRTTIMQRREERKDLQQNILQQKREFITGTQELRKETTQERCQKVTQKVTDITSKYNMGPGGRLKSFKAMSERLKKVAVNLEEKGIDTTDLTTAIATLDTKIQTLETDYQKFIDALNNTKQFECGNSQGAFRNASGEAQTIFQQVRLDIMDIEKYLKNDMKKVLETLRLQKLSVTPISPSIPVTTQ